MSLIYPQLRGDAKGAAEMVAAHGVPRKVFCLNDWDIVQERAQNRGSRSRSPWAKFGYNLGVLETTGGLPAWTSACGESRMDDRYFSRAATWHWLDERLVVH